MGTRGLFGFRKNGRRRASYNHFDSDLLALVFGHFLKQISAAELARLAKLVDELTWVDAQALPEPVTTVNTYERYGYNTCELQGRCHGRRSWGYMQYAIQGVKVLPEILDGKPKHMTDEFDADYPNLEWLCLVDFDVQEVEIWEGRSEFAVVSFNGLVQAINEYEANIERYTSFTIFLRENFAIGSFGSDYRYKTELPGLDLRILDEHRLKLSEPAGPTAGTPESGSFMALPTELHLRIIHYLQVDTTVTASSFYDNGKASVQAQWALKRTRKRFWNLPGLTAPSDFFSLFLARSLRTIQKRDHQRLILDAWTPSSFLASHFPCYNCHKFLPLTELPPFWGGTFFLWSEQYLSCCLTCATEMAREGEGEAVARMYYTEGESNDQDPEFRHKLDRQLTRANCLRREEVRKADTLRLNWSDCRAADIKRLNLFDYEC